eukprot:g27314.t1
MPPDDKALPIHCLWFHSLSKEQQGVPFSRTLVHSLGVYGLRANLQRFAVMLAISKWWVRKGRIFCGHVVRC